jgi:hypothetical protein
MRPLQNFYYEHPAVTARSESEVQRYREMRDIHVTGEGVPKPVTTFDEASFPGGWPCAPPAAPFLAQQRPGCAPQTTGLHVNAWGRCCSFPAPVVPRWRLSLSTE